MRRLDCIPFNLPQIQAAAMLSHWEVTEATALTLSSASKLSQCSLYISRSSLDFRMASVVWFQNNIRNRRSEHFNLPSTFLPLLLISCKPWKTSYKPCFTQSNELSISGYQLWGHTGIIWGNVYKAQIAYTPIQTNYIKVS